MQMKWKCHFSRTDPLLNLRADVGAFLESQLADETPALPGFGRWFMATMRDFGIVDAIAATKSIFSLGQLLSY